MTCVYPTIWERSLLPLADEAEAQEQASTPSSRNDTRLLDRAYASCASITAMHSRTFSLATRLLSAEKRRAMHALYAFCRVSDDIVDSPGQDAGEALAAWRQTALGSAPPPGNLVAIAWADARARYHIPQRYAEQLLEGVGRDLQQKSYHTFEDVARYAYGVASTVGLMSMHIIGFASKKAIPYAIKLGVALQLTNILRDVAEDWRVGRLYLPLDEMSSFGVAEADLTLGQMGESWKSLMRFQIERNRRLYEEARPGIALLHRDGRFAVAAASELYCAILDDIESHDYDIFHRRAQVSVWGKIRRLPGIWWRQRQGSSDEAL